MNVSNGSVPNSNQLTFNTPGDYYFQAVYSGDANNAVTSSKCTDEHLVVKANPSITTVLSAPTINAGGTVTYSVYTDSACTQRQGRRGHLSTSAVAQFRTPTS